MCHKFGCVFYSPTTMTCDYFLITGKLRGCPATDDCEKYRLTLGDEKPVYKGFKPRRVTQKRLDHLEHMYQKYGKNAASLNEFCQVSGLGTQIGLGYVRKVHPESPLLDKDRWWSP